MKNKSFFYLQYNKINWENQEKTKINSLVNNFIINKFILKNKGQQIKIFDIGFGIGFFLNRLYQTLSQRYKKIILEGCEPSEKNYKCFLKKQIKQRVNIRIKTQNKTFLNTKTNEKFDFITAIYVFPHFAFDELKETLDKIHSMLEKKGKFIFVVANEKYLEGKLKTQKDLFIEKTLIKFKGNEYTEILHYSDIPEIGKIIDYNREERFYIDLFEKNKFKLVTKEDLNDSGFICTIFVFEKK